ncbi:tRNA preQ1(34) S-adenosylmethionine ribosyltransferase-isomerase QueA [Roseomonas frigidaquae]|uniref:S-adenosylmethionine:tRNA ribosyltransferase-isomerase n=1 Tax=Falsiroseomonas frigidaquae TaxID=487318 RepID=A0ABX1F5T2_9PROT|nr:tRNA preQ1(34) S-adenosylmethionine ribosyltransferase-isomerase QueA [Falsiroseomonas frigidaquae]NKE47581.1 tRNA preQ1(34) S-adenosylmethionine ribosyltransferase-isomerase QueA [Falsiroseomonas frigidaquae]
MPEAPPQPPLRTEDFDFALPEGLIAQAPARPRDAARLLVVRPDGLADRGVLDLPGLLQPGDVLVVNDTRVIPARLKARRGEARIEIMLNRAEGGGLWQALVRNARRLRVGDVVEIEGAPGCTARVVERQDGGSALFDFGPDQAALAAALEQAGEIPLPPYIQRDSKPGAEDAADYQTIFARHPGAVAAPTASLHFTDQLLAALDERGITRVPVTLHVGAGTFLPVRDEDPRAHRIHQEWCEMPAASAAAINTARAAGRRIVAVGTTALRTLESAAAEDGTVAPFRGLTGIYILPGHRFRVADALLTNFHLPKSTLLMLVSAFAGTRRMRGAYAHAIREGYRFFSYGDGSLLFRCDQDLSE